MNKGMKSLFENDCLLDVFIKPSDLHYFRSYHLSAVYVLFSKRTPLYVGESTQLYNRLRGHFKGNCVTTRDIIAEVDEIGLFFTKYLAYYETAFITQFNPPLNTFRGKSTISHCILHEMNIPKKCGKCNIRAHVNGFCYKHGGNGILPEVYADRQAEEIIKNNIQLKLII